LLSFEKERDILISCLREEKPQVQDMDFDRLFEICQWEGVSPLLYKKLNKHRELKTVFPQEFLDKLKKAYIWTKIQNKLFLDEIKRLSKNAPLLLIKGAALLMVVYDDYALRPMEDIDIIVREDNLEYVHKVLINDGYRLIKTEYSKWDRRLGSGRTYVKELITIDLFTHLEALYIGANKSRQLFLNAVQIGDNLFILATEDLILHCLIHMANHHFFYRLIWLYDVKEIIQKLSVDWDRVLIKLKKVNFPFLITEGLREVKEIFSLDIPSDILKARELKRNCYINWIKKYHGRIKIADNISSFLSIPGIKNKLVLLFSALFPSYQYLRVRFQTSNTLFLFFLRIIRPFYVFYKFFKKIFGR